MGYSFSSRSNLFYFIDEGYDGSTADAGPSVEQIRNYINSQVIQPSVDLSQLSTGTMLSYDLTLKTFSF